MEIPAEPNTQSDLSVCATVTTITKSVACFSFLIGACERLFFSSFIYLFFYICYYFVFQMSFVCAECGAPFNGRALLFSRFLSVECVLCSFFSIFTFDFLFHFDVHCILLKMLTRFPLSRIFDSVELYEVIRLRIMAKCTQYALALKKHL